MRVSRPIYPPPLAIQLYGAGDVGLFGIGRKLRKLSRGVKRSVRKVSRKVKRATRKVSRTVKRAGRTVSRAAKRYGATALRTAATGASFVPGVGTGVAAGLSAASALAAGKSWQQIAEQAAIGALPGGQLARAGVRAGLAVARGQRLDRAALSAARSAVPGGSLGRAAFDVARAAAGGKRVDRALVSVASRHAGRALAQVAPSVGVPKMPLRPFTSARVLRRLERKTAPAVIPHGRGEMLARQAMKRNPRLGALPPEEAARALGLATRHILAARKMGGASLRWQGLPKRTAALVRRVAPFARYVSRRDTAGLAPDGKSYTMESGDYLSKIAQKITGSAGRWKELLPVNPSYPRHKEWGMVMHPGDVLALPESWWPEPSPEQMTAAAIMQAKALLVTWSKTAGAGSAGVTDYGQRPEDIAPTWSERDRLTLSSFSVWRGRGLATDGELTETHLDELKVWATEAATGAAASPAIPVSLPAEVPELPAPAATGAAPATVLAELPTITQTAPATSTLPSSEPTSAGQPTVFAEPAEPGPVSVPTAAPKKKKDDGLGIAAAIALGALFL